MRKSSAFISGAIAAILLPCVSTAEEAPVFNGKDLAGWTATSKGKKQEVGDCWKVEDGVIIGDNPEKNDSVLWTGGRFGDFELNVEFMTPSPDYDSGVFVFSEAHQVQIGISRSLKKDLTGCVYAPADGKGSYPAVSEKVTEVHKPGEWNRLRILVEGKRIRTWLNDVPFVDYESVKLGEGGAIGFQLHQGVHQTISFRKLRVSSVGD